MPFPNDDNIVEIMAEQLNARSMNITVMYLMFEIITD